MDADFSTSDRPGRPGDDSSGKHGMKTTYMNILKDRAGTVLVVIVYFS